MDSLRCLHEGRPREAMRFAALYILIFGLSAFAWVGMVFLQASPDEWVAVGKLNMLCYKAGSICIVFAMMVFGLSYRAPEMAPN